MWNPNSFDARLTVGARPKDRTIAFAAVLPALKSQPSQSEALSSARSKGISNSEPSQPST